MEDNKTDNSSDRDRKMMGKFETYAEAQEAKTKKKRPKRSLFLPSIEDDKEEDKKPGLFEAFKKTETDDDQESEKSEETAEQVDDSPEQLTDEEEHWVESQIITAHQEELKSELAEAEDDSSEEAEALATGAFLENLQEKLDAGEVLDDETLDEAMAETVENLDIEQGDEASSIEADVEIPEVDGETDEDGLTPVIPATPLPTPPVPPAVPRPAPVGPMPVGPNVFNPNPNIDLSESVVERRHNRGADILVGGIVGYLLGRRRGRIRTEEKLIPIQEKLKKEVSELNEKILLREEKIRSNTAQKIDQLDGNPTGVIERLEQRLERKRGITSQPEIKATEEAAEKVRTNTDIFSVPQLLEVADGIRREGVSVKHLYETGRLDSQGLRRVVQEYLRGGAYEKILFEELKGDEFAREQSIERATTSKVNSDAAALGVGGLFPDSHKELSFSNTSKVENHPLAYSPTKSILGTSSRQFPLLAVVAFGILIAFVLMIVLF